MLRWCCWTTVASLTMGCAPGAQVGLGEGLAPSSATNVMARQVPECAAPRCLHLHHPVAACTWAVRSPAILWIRVQLCVD